MRSDLEAQAAMTGVIQAEFGVGEVAESRRRLQILQQDLDCESNTWKENEPNGFTKFTHHMQNARLVTVSELRMWDVVAWYPTPTPYRKILHEILCESHYLIKVAEEIAHIQGRCIACPEGGRNLVHANQCLSSPISEEAYATVNYPQQFGSSPCPFRNGPADYRPQGENNVRLHWISASLEIREVLMSHSDVGSFWPHREWKHSIQAMLISWLQEAKCDLMKQLDSSTHLDAGLVQELLSKVQDILDTLLRYLEVSNQSYADKYMSDFITPSAKSEIQREVLRQVPHYDRLLKRSLAEIAGDHPLEQGRVLLCSVQSIDANKSDSVPDEDDGRSQKHGAISEGPFELGTLPKYAKTSENEISKAIPSVSTSHTMPNREHGPNNAIVRCMNRFYVSMLPSSHYPRAMWTLTSRFGGRMSMIEIFMVLSHHDGDLEKATTSIERRLERKLQRQRVH